MEDESQRVFEGFSNDNTFQVHCSINLFQVTEKSRQREALLHNCQNRLVRLLAKFKIAYDYNIKNLKFQASGQDIHQSKKESYKMTNESVKIFNLDQIVIDWDTVKTNQLLNHYGKYLPGQILYEWLENDREHFIYFIRKPSLMNEVKNTPLPFGVEIQNEQ